MCRHDRPYLVPVAPAEPDPDFDPALEMRRLAGRLAQAYGADPSNAALARELRNTLLVIRPTGEAEEDAAWQKFIDGLGTPTYPEQCP